MTFWQALRASEFWLLLVSAVAAVLGLPWWVVVPLTVAGLSISSLPKYIELWPRAVEANVQGEWWRTVGLSLLNTLGASVAAFMMGLAIRWVWW